VVLVRAGAECDGGKAKDVGERETEVLRECERTWAPRIGRDWGLGWPKRKLVNYEIVSRM
jgi:hypothetical protein